MLADALLRTWLELEEPRSDDGGGDAALQELSALPHDELRRRLSGSSTAELRSLVSALIEGVAKAEPADADLIQASAQWFELLAEYPDDTGRNRRLAADAELLRALVKDAGGADLEASRRFRLAAFGYDTVGARAHKALAEVGIAAGSHAVGEGTSEQVATALAALGPAGSGLVEPLAARAEAVAEIQRLGDAPGDLAERAASWPPERRKEYRRAAERQVWRSLRGGDLDAAVAWARAADELGSELHDASAVRGLAEHLSTKRQYVQAAPLFEELHERDPSTEIALALANAYRGTGRVAEAAALLERTIGEEPGPGDAEVLLALAATHYLTGDSAAAERWEKVLAEVAPERAFASLAPRAPPLPAPTPRLARFRDGELHVSQDLLELPADEQTAHMTAAIVEGSPDGQEILSATLSENAELGQRVAALLGLPDMHVDLGEQHFRAGRLDDAEAAYREALRLAPGHAIAALWLGDVFYRRGQYGLAQAHFEESLAIEPSPQAWRFIADSMRSSGQPDARARQAYLRALQLDPSYGGARQALDELDSRQAGSDEASSGDGGAAGQAGREDASEEQPVRRVEPAEPAEAVLAARFREAAASGEGAGVSARLAGATIAEELETAIGEQDRALAELLRDAEDDERFAAWLERHEASAWSRALFTITALVYQWASKVGNLARAETLARRGVQIASRIPTQWPEGDNSDLGRARHNASAHEQLGGVLADAGRFAEAHAQLLEAEHWFRVDEEERSKSGVGLTTEFDRLFHTRDVRAMLYESLILSAQRLGDAEAERHYMELAAEADLNRPSDELVVQRVVGFAMAAVDSNRFDEGLLALHAALEPAERDAASSMVPRSLANVEHHLGKAHSRVELYRSALAHYSRAVELNDLTGNADRLAMDWTAIGDVRRRRPDIGSAIEAYEQALELASAPAAELAVAIWHTQRGEARRITAPERAWPVLQPLAYALEAEGALSAAMEVLEIAADLAERVRAGLRTASQRTQLQDERSNVLSMLARLHLAAAGEARQGPEVDAAFVATERLRARTFLDMVGTAPLHRPAGVSAALLEEEQSLLGERAALEGAEPFDWEQHRFLSKRLEVLWATVAQSGQSGQDYAEVRRGEPADADDIAHALRDSPEVVLLSYALLDDESLALFAWRHDEGITAARLDVDARRALRFVTDNFGEASRVRELATDMEDLLHHELDALVTPLTDLTRPNEILLVAPTGALHNVPLHALQVDGDPLLARNAVVYLPSASMLRSIRRRTQDGAVGASAVVVGDPLGDLEHARDESAAIGARWGVEPLVGPNATCDAVLSAMPAAARFHAACHASFDLEDPMASGLNLADGVLDARTIIGQSWQGLQLAVLSACETGVTRAGRADEIVGLSRALLFAGTRSLVVSLWRVPDETTAAIMEDFYDRVEGDEAPCEALRGAMLGARDRPRSARLHHWAGFSVVGDWS